VVSISPLPDFDTIALDAAPARCAVKTNRGPTSAASPLKVNRGASIAGGRIFRLKPPRGKKKNKKKKQKKRAVLLAYSTIAPATLWSNPATRPRETVRPERPSSGTAWSFVGNRLLRQQGFKGRIYGLDARRQILWEQFLVPLHAGDKALWSPAAPTPRPCRPRLGNAPGVPSQAWSNLDAAMRSIPAQRYPPTAPAATPPPLFNAQLRPGPTTTPLGEVDWARGVVSPWPLDATDRGLQGRLPPSSTATSHYLGRLASPP